MSGDKFYHSESIVKLKTLLSKNMEPISNISSITDDESTILQDFLKAINEENFGHITISQDAAVVVTSFQVIYRIPYAY